MTHSRRTILAGAAALAGQAMLPLPLRANTTPGAPSDTYTMDEIVSAGHTFFGKMSEGLAKSIEHLFRNQGLPNGYILGEEGSGAFVAGLRYGEGSLNTKNAGQRKVFWQGPSIGWDFGGDGARTMMLVYNLPDVQAIYRHYPGVNGSAYLVAGAGVSIYSNHEIFLAPIRTGIGARLGVNVGYLKLTPEPTWNPF